MISTAARSYGATRSVMQRRAYAIASAGGGVIGALAVLLASLPLLLASPLAAQQGRPPQDAEITLVYDREVFTYEESGRRDPFGPLTGQGIGPRFEDLTLQGIIYSTGAGRSVALLMDGSGQIHRVHSGDIVGNVRVLEIEPLRVLFAVDEFGTIRQEFLELQRRATIGATGS